MISGFFIGKRKPKLSETIALPLIRYGIPLSVMGLLLKEGIDLNLIKTLNKYLLKNIKVSFTFLNVVNKKNLQKRLKQRKSLNRYDKFRMSFYNKVQKGFLNLSKKQKNKYQLINSNLDINNNEKLILDKIDRLIK